MISLVALLTGAAAPFLWVKGDSVIPGVRINGVAAGGFSKAQMVDFLQEENKAMEKENLNLVKDSVKETWNYKDLHVSYDERSLDEAMAIGRQGSLSSSGKTAGQPFSRGKRPTWMLPLMRKR